MPAYIVIVASLVTVVQFLMQAYLPSLSKALGVYIPLIVVNCIILGRAESYASKNGPIESIFDGIGMGLGFTMGLTIIGLIREILGAGTFFGLQFLSAIKGFTPITIFIMAPGAFLVLAFLVAGMNIIRKKMEAKGKPPATSQGKPNRQQRANRLQSRQDVYPETVHTVVSPHFVQERVQELLIRNRHKEGERR